MLSGGEQVRNYRLERRLSDGGMGSVWLAADTKLGRAVAIKILTGTTGEDASARFLREAQTIAQLKSDHTVRIFDVDSLPDGTPFMVMEYLTGESLAQVVEHGPLEPGTAIDYILQACEALAEAHAAGIVHRDIKPGNLMLTEGPGKRPRIKLVDFGIAKAKRIPTEEITITGTVLGTPYYMSPEQVRESSDVDPRSDIWSLGVVLFELVAGSRPFQAEDAYSQLKQIVEAAPEPLPKTTPDGLRDIILRCLAKERTSRFANVASLSRALSPFAGDRADAARLLERASVYLGGGFAGAATMLQLQAPRQLASEKADAEPWPADPWKAFNGAIPTQLAPNRVALLDVFSRVFERSEPVADNIVKLVGSAIASDQQTEFFAVFMSHASVELGGAPAIGQTTFAAYVGPLRSYLEKLGAARRKVVIVVASIGELGPGVRDSIGEYRRNLNTLVVPIWLRELQRAYLQDRAWDVIENRLNDLHANQDPFVIDLDALDPMRCVGMGARVNEVVQSLKDGGRIINITALPGCGKSTLVRLVQYELAARSFIVIRCSERGQSPRGLGREILAGIAHLAGGPENPEAAGDGEEDFSEALSAQLRTPFLPRKVLTMSLNHLSIRPLLVLEDADWLIALVASPDATPARDEARALWTALSEVSRKHKLDVILTSVRGYELDHAMLAGWENPARPHTVEVPLLSLRETALLVRELAAGIASFTTAAIELVHRATRGNVGLTLAVCSAAFRSSTQRSDTGPLVPTSVTVRDVRHAAGRVASMDKPIGPVFNSLLSDNERYVLWAVARSPARSLGPLRGVLKDATAVDRAMRELQAMGMVDFDNHRYRVAIPAVAEWARRHLVRTEHQAASAWRARTRVVSVGAIFSMLLFATYFVWVRNQRSDLQVSAPDGCMYRVDVPERAEYDVPVVVYAFRSCRDLPKEPRLMLQPERVAAQIDVPATDACATQPDCMLEARVTLKAQKDGSYPFVLKTGKQKALEFKIDHDALASLKATLSDIFRVMSFLPIVLGVGLAFYGDVLKAVRNWFKRDGAPSPDAPAASTANNVS